MAYSHVKTDGCPLPDDLACDGVLRGNPQGEVCMLIYGGWCAEVHIRELIFAGNEVSDCLQVFGFYG